MSDEYIGGELIKMVGWVLLIIVMAHLAGLWWGIGVFAIYSILTGAVITSRASKKGK